MAEREEIKTINHLLEVEKNAQAIIQAAQAEADKKVSMAKAETEKKFRAEFEKMVSEKESEFSAKSEQISLEVKKESEDFKKRISSLTIDVEAFGRFLDGVLFA